MKINQNGQPNQFRVGSDMIEVIGGMTIAI